MIFVNVGQITNNIVSRNIYLASMKPGNVAQVLREDGLSIDNIMSNDGGSPMGAAEGIRRKYTAGMYGYCGGDSTEGSRACSEMKFGYIFDPAQIIGSDLPGSNEGRFRNIFDNWDNGTYSRKHWTPAFYLSFLGTIFVGVAFLTTCLIHMAAIVVAGVIGLLGFALLAAGASIWTADLYGLCNSASAGLSFNYGNALGMTWAAVGSTLLSLPALVTSSYASHTRWDDGMERGNYYQHPPY